MQETAETRLAKTFFIVEANSNEQFLLWQTWSKESRYRPAFVKKPLDWDQLLDGWLVTVGELDKRPVCITVNWAKIKGRLVMFWYQCSQVTDSLQTEAWLKKHFSRTWDSNYRRSSCDASNFHLCLEAIKEDIEEEEKAKWSDWTV